MLPANTSGWDILTELQTFETPPPMIIVTAYYSEEFFRRAIAAGFVDCLRKPLPINHLKEVVRRHVA